VSDKGKGKAKETSQIPVKPISSENSGNPEDSNDDKNKKKELISNSTTTGVVSGMTAFLSKVGGSRALVMGSIAKAIHGTIDLVNDHPEEAKRLGTDLAIGMSKGLHGSKDNLHDLGEHSVAQLAGFKKAASASSSTKMTSPLENSDSFSAFIMDSDYYNGFANLYNGLVNQMLLFNSIALVSIFYFLFYSYVIKNSDQILRKEFFLKDS
jgi:hypothetical protein